MTNLLESCFKICRLCTISINAYTKRVGCCCIVGLLSVNVESGRDLVNILNIVQYVLQRFSASMEACLMRIRFFLQHWKDSDEPQLLN